MASLILKKDNEENTIGNELQSVWLLGVLWTCAHMGPFLCTVVINSIIENADGFRVLSYHLKQRHTIHVLFYCYLGLSVLGFCFVVILRTVDLVVRQQETKDIVIIKWRIRICLLAPFVLFLANSIELAIYLVLLVQDIAGNGYKLMGFWGCFLLAMSIIIFLVIIIMITSIFMSAAEANRLKQAIVKSAQQNNEQIVKRQILWNHPYPNTNNHSEWMMNSLRIPPRIAETIQGNMTHNYNPSILPYQNIPQIQGSESSSWSRQLTSDGFNSRAMFEYQRTTEAYVPDPARYL